MNYTLVLLLLLLFPLRQGRRIADNDNHRISPQKHLADVPVLVDGLPSGFPLSSLGVFRPHFLHVLQEPVNKQQREKAKITATQKSGRESFGHQKVTRHSRDRSTDKQGIYLLRNQERIAKHPNAIAIPV